MWFGLSCLQLSEFPDKHSWNFPAVGKSCLTSCQVCLVSAAIKRSDGFTPESTVLPPEGSKASHFGTLSHFFLCCTECSAKKQHLNQWYPTSKSFTYYNIKTSCKNGVYITLMIKHKTYNCYMSCFFIIKNISGFFVVWRLHNQSQGMCLNLQSYCLQSHYCHSYLTPLLNLLYLFLSTYVVFIFYP